MKILLDGLFVLNLYKEEIAIFFVSTLGAGLWIVRFLLPDRKEDDYARLPMAFGLGSLALVLFAFAVILLSRLWYPFLLFGSFLVLILAVLAFLDSLRRGEFLIRSLIIFCLFFFGLAVIRLAFLRNILLPPYNDSPEHYAIIQSFLSSSGSSLFYSIENITGHYYHFGFHSLAAWISSVFLVDQAGIIGLLGQLFLVVFPFSIFILAYVVGRDWRAGLASASFAAFAWRMPVYAANWGKYPAMMGIALFPVVIACWILYMRSSKRSRIALGVLCVLTAALVFVHSRLAVCLLVALISFVLIGKFPINERLKLWQTALLAGFTCIGFLAFGNSLFPFYANGYFVALGSVALLLPFAFYVRPRFSLGITFFVWGILIASRVPTFIEGGGLTWLDQPFVEILLSIPLSLSAGIGFIGLLEQLKSPNAKRIAIGGIVAILLIGFTTSNVMSPDPCCNYVKPEDLQAIQWLKQNAPQDAVVWIPGFKSRNYMLGMDAGIWVQPLTGLNANKLPYDFAWNAPDAIARICKPNIKDVYIYEGGQPYSFDDAILAEQSWLRRVFSLEQTRVYWAMACANQMSH